MDLEISQKRVGESLVELSIKARRTAKYL